MENKQTPTVEELNAQFSDPAHRQTTTNSDNLSEGGENIENAD